MRYILAAAVWLAAATPLLAQTKISMGYSPTTDYVAAFAAKEKGFFAKRGLDVEFVFIPINSVQPAALVGNSIQVSALTSSTFVQAVSNGLDLVSAIGISVSSAEGSTAGVMVRNGVIIEKPADFVGKKVGVPGIGAVLDVMFRTYLLQNGVSPAKVIFLEAGLPQHPDMLSSGSLDAVVTVDPMLSSIKSRGIGTLSADLFSAIPNQLMGVYAMTRAWASSHPTEVKAFQEAILEGVEFAKNNVEESRTIIAKYAKLPPELMNAVRLPPALQTKVTADQLQWWFNTMKQQGLVDRTTDFKNAILN